VAWFIDGWVATSPDRQKCQGTAESDHSSPRRQIAFLATQYLVMFATSDTRSIDGKHQTRD